MKAEAHPSALDSRTEDARQILARNAACVDEAFERVMAHYDGPAKLIEAIGYSFRAGGKRLRPTLVLETARVIDPAGAHHNAAVAAAVAVELIHAFSLVHDDLPAMDDDDLRRGLPTNHTVFGEAMAILAGDAMVTIAFESIARDAASPNAARLVLELARAAGPAGMVGGQVLDIEGENQRLSLAQVRSLHARKTGALLTASCRLGAIAAGADAGQLAAFSDFGTHMGLAFQIIDDILDVTATSDQLGKTPGKDAAAGKNTYPALLGLEGARVEADKQLAAGLAAVACFGPAAEPLRTLARFVVERDR